MRAPTKLIPLVKEFGFEGIIAKRKDSYYEIGKRLGGLGEVQGPIDSQIGLGRIPLHLLLVTLLLR